MPESPFVEGHDKFVQIDRHEKGEKNNIRSSDFNDGSDFWTD
jgi:hypothetical protein